MTLVEMGALLRQNQISAFELTQKALESIRKQDGAIGAFLSVLEENALAEAMRFDARKDKEKWQSPLAGIPFALKDNIMTKGHATTCASRILLDFVPPYDATVMECLKQSGAVLLGKTNMDEFGMGSECANSAYLQTVNPLAPAHLPGGSSGGSAAAVAADFVPFALGSDTGGSVRLPSAYCNLVGMRPTYGSVSRYGLVAFASSMDVIGPMTKTVEDNALVLSAIRGRDERDSTSHDVFPLTVPANRPLRIGILSELMGQEIAPACRRAVTDAAKCLDNLGHTVQYVSLDIRDSLFAYYVISSAEASSNLARFDGVRYGKRVERGSMEEMYEDTRGLGFGEEVKRRIRLGTYVLTKEHKNAYYERSLDIRERLKAEYARIFAEFDLLLCPTAPDTAPKIGSIADPTVSYQRDLCTVPASLAGIPALTVPFGKDENNLPTGVQLMGKAYSEALLYYVGRLLEVERNGIV